LRDLFDFLFDVSGGRTVSGKPLAGRIGIDSTILTRRVIHYFVTTFTLFNNDMTTASIKPATFLVHESTFRSTFDGLTDHWNHTPFFFKFFIRMTAYLKAGLANRK
jgi:hypothetical protein